VKFIHVILNYQIFLNKAKITFVYIGYCNLFKDDEENFAAILFTQETVLSTNGDPL
jgi:hypothetical protein